MIEHWLVREQKAVYGFGIGSHKITIGLFNDNKECVEMSSPISQEAAGVVDVEDGKARG